MFNFESKSFSKEQIPFFHETCFLSSILTFPDLILKVNSYIRSVDFFVKENGMIYDILKSFYEKNNSIDPCLILQIITEKEQEKENERLSYHFLNNIVKCPSDIHNFSTYASRIKNKSLLRKIKNFSNILTDLVDESKSTEDPKFIVDKAEQMLSNLLDENISNENLIYFPTDFSNILKEVFSDSKKGIQTMLKNVDDIFNGFKDTEVTVIAARPSVGKTAFGITAALNIAKQKFKVAFFSLEMSSKQILTRIISNISNINSSRIINQNLNEEEIKKLEGDIHLIKDFPFFLVDIPSASIFDIKNTCRILKMRNGLDIIFIDYIQLVNVPGRFDTRNSELTQITKEIKSLARELGIPIIVMSQLSRLSEQTKERRPLLSHLKSSGSIEEHFDNVAFLHRDDEIYNHSDRIKKIEFIVAKHRNGPTGKTQLDFISSISRFLDAHIEESK